MYIEKVADYTLKVRNTDAAYLLITKIENREVVKVCKQRSEYEKPCCNLRYFEIEDVVTGSYLDDTTGEDNTGDGDIDDGGLW